MASRLETMARTPESRSKSAGVPRLRGFLSSAPPPRAPHPHRSASVLPLRPSLPLCCPALPLDPAREEWHLPIPPSGPHRRSSAFIGGSTPHPRLPPVRL